MIRDVIGVLTLIVVVAGVSAAIARGQNTAAIIGKFGESFAGVIRAATLQGE